RLPSAGGSRGLFRAVARRPACHPARLTPFMRASGSHVLLSGSAWRQDCLPGSLNETWCIRMAAIEPPLKRTPLYEQHLALGARIVPFAGWEMPVQYSGVIEEVRAVRQQAGLFDVSHMGELHVSGPAALAWLNSMATNDIARLAAGRAH